MASPATVWCVFEAKIDGDSYLHWEFLFNATNLTRAQDLVAELVQPGNLDWIGVHPTMNKYNNYTFIGSREECSLGYDDEESCHYAKGYVIEAQLVQ